MQGQQQYCQEHSEIRKKWFMIWEDLFNIGLQFQLQFQSCSTTDMFYARIGCQWFTSGRDTTGNHSLS